jgi:hypothetical protein
LFIDLENKLSYVNKNEEKSILKQGVVEKWIFRSNTKVKY